MKSPDDEPEDGVGDADEPEGVGEVDPEVMESPRSEVGVSDDIVKRMQMEN